MHLKEKLVIAISSRALFDLDESNQIFEQQGLDEYQQYQVEHEDQVLAPGEAFHLVKKLLDLNELIEAESQLGVEIILLSRNSADTGLRVFNSIEHHRLNISRAAFCGGRSPYRYVLAFGCHLFLSSHQQDVRHALTEGVAAAQLVSASSVQKTNQEIRFAFDGDAVLFSDEAEKVYKTQGLAAFMAQERHQAKTPLAGGPFKPFLERLQLLQKHLSATSPPIRTALVTARSAPTHERVIRTLRAWDIRIDESLFLGGLDKTAFLQAFGADVFFDDQKMHCDSASANITTGHVPYGVANETHQSALSESSDIATHHEGQTHTSEP